MNTTSPYPNIIATVESTSTLNSTKIYSPTHADKYVVKREVITVHTLAQMCATLENASPVIMREQLLLVNAENHKDQ